MDEIEPRWIIKFLLKEGTDADEIQHRMKALYRDSSSAFSTIYEWMLSFSLGRMEIHGFRRSERPPINDIDDDIMFLLRSFPFLTVRAFAETLSVSPTTILQNLRNSLGVKPYHIPCVTHGLASHVKV
jgi:hypothetical protein